MLGGGEMKTKLPQWKMLCASLGKMSAPASTWRWPSTTWLSTTINIFIIAAVGIHHQSCQLHHLQWLHNSHNGQPQDFHSRQYYKSHHVQVCVDGSEEKCSTRLDKVCPLPLNNKSAWRLRQIRRDQDRRLNFSECFHWQLRAFISCCPSYLTVRYATWWRRRSARRRRRETWRRSAPPSMWRSANR